ncbi:hypothetical protein LJM23_005146 [Citrobacter freundii]|nr:hypothetical protein [Citrobacter freundii]
MKNATRLLVISLALMLSGCAYSPKQVEASRPLVNQTASTDLQAMAANLQQPLNTLPQGAALSANGNTYILGQRYGGLRANGTKTYAKEITNCYN